MTAWLSCAAALQASTWTGQGGNTLWHTSGNWNDKVPDLSIDSVFNASRAYAVTFNNTAAAKSMLVSAGSPAFDLLTYKLALSGELAVAGGLSSPSTLSLTGGTVTATSAFIGRLGNSGSLSLTGSATNLTVSGGNFNVGYSRTANGPPQGTLSVKSGATVTADGIFIGTAGATGQATIDGGNLFTSSTGTLNVGTNKFSTFGDTNGTLTVTNGGKINSTAGVTTAIIGGAGGIGSVSLQIAATAWTHKGSIFVGASSGGSLGTGTLEVTSGAALSVSASTSAGIKVFKNAGTLKLSGTGSKISLESLDLDGSADNFQFTGGTLELNSATVSNLGTTTLNVGGILAGSGTVNGKVSVTSTGVVSPGTTAAAGTLRTTGNFTSLGKTEMRLFNVNSAGKLIVDGTATLNGTVSVSLMNGYSPAVGTAFDLLDFVGPLAGTYGMDFSAAPLPAGKWWDTSAFASSGVVSVQGTPEPGTMLLVLLSSLPLLGRRRH